MTQIDYQNKHILGFWGFGLLVLFWPYFGPCNLYTKKISHCYQVAKIAQMAEHCSFDLEAQVQILTRVQSFFFL